MALGDVLVAARALTVLSRSGLLVLPGVLTIVVRMMPELLELGSCSRRSPGPWERVRGTPRWAIAAFTLAALTRESSLLVPLALIPIELPRAPCAFALAPRSRRLAIPFVVYAGVDRVRHATCGVHGRCPHAPRRLTGLPFGGLVNASRSTRPTAASAALWCRRSRMFVLRGCARARPSGRAACYTVGRVRA